MKEFGRLPYSETISTEEMEQIYSWDPEDVVKAQEKWDQENPEGTRGPIFRWVALQELEALRTKYEKDNDPKHILPALFQCTLDGIPIPSWCALAFRNAYREIRHYGAKSWDEVFGRPHPPKTNLSAKRNKLYNKFKVFQRVREIKRDNPETPIDEYLFEVIGRDLGIGGSTKVSEMYYEVQNMFKISKS